MIKWEKSILINKPVEHYDVDNTKWVIVLYQDRLCNDKKIYHSRIRNKFMGVVLNRLCGSQTLYDENYEILKLKCIIKAKELGWNIK